MKNTNKPAHPFIVKESRGINLLVAAFLFLLGITILVYEGPSDSGSIIFAVLLMLSGLVFLIKVFRRKKIFEVNEQGIYYYDELVTGWNNYVNSYFKEEENNNYEYRATDFFLYIEHIKPGTGRIFISKILSSNTQNKSEEAIINAIRYYAENKMNAK